MEERKSKEESIHSLVKEPKLEGEQTKTNSNRHHETNGRLRDFFVLVRDPIRGIPSLCGIHSCKVGKEWEGMINYFTGEGKIEVSRLRLKWLTRGYAGGKGPFN